MDRIKVKLSKPEFIYNGRAVVCRMKAMVPELDLSYQVTGIAKCNEGDNYDEVVGKRISQARAEIKARNIAKEYSREFVKCMKREIERYENLISDVDKFNNRDREAIKRFVED